MIMQFTFHDIIGYGIAAAMEYPLAAAMEYPLAAVIEYPLAAVIEYPAAAAIEFPLAAVIEYPAAAVMEYPLAAVIEYPLAAVMEYPAAAVIEFPLAAVIEYPAAAAMEFPAAAAIHQHEAFGNGLLVMPYLARIELLPVGIYQCPVKDFVVAAPVEVVTYDLHEAVKCLRLVCPDVLLGAGMGLMRPAEYLLFQLFKSFHNS